MNANAAKYIKQLQDRGPRRWAEGAHGWINPEGAPVTLEPWQRGVLDLYFEHRRDISTLGISNVKKTGKTFLNAVVLAWRWLALPGQHFAAGNDLDQSQARQFQEIADMVKRNPFLFENVKISKMELEFKLTGSKLTALAADAAGNAGANHLTVSHTEAWGILYEAGIRSWEELTPPPGESYGLPALRVVDSYAGFSGESNTWHKLVDRGLSGPRISTDWPVYKTGGLMLFHAEGSEAQEKCFRGKPAQRIDYYAEQAETMRPNAFSRMHRNQRTSGESAFVTTEQWEACFSLDVHPLQPGERVDLYLGADASQKHDYTALIGTQKRDGKTAVRFVKIWKPKKLSFGKNAAVDLEETIGKEVLQLHQARQVAAVCYDPWQLATVAKQWEKAGIKCIEMPQTAQRIESDTALFNAIVSGSIEHYKNPELDEAVRNAIIIETPRGMRIAKEKSSKKIDALIALSMSHHAAIDQPAYIVTSTINPFYVNNADEFISVAGQWIHAPGHTAQPHPEGVTWRNCRKRNKGCEAYIFELEVEGIYKKQEEEKSLSLARGAGEPMSPDEFIREFYGPLIYRQQKQTEQEYKNEQIIQRFKRAAKLGE